MFLLLSRSFFAVLGRLHIGSDLAFCVSRVLGLTGSSIISLVVVRIIFVLLSSIRNCHLALTKDWHSI
jgi:hypothetical protein